MSNSKLFPKTVGSVGAPVFLTLLTVVPSATLPQALRGWKEKCLWPGVALSRNYLEENRRRDQHRDRGGSQSFQKGSWTPGSHFPFHSQVNEQPASSMFPTRFEDYQRHLLGGSCMGLSSAVPRGKPEGNGVEKANFLETQEEEESKEKCSICFLQVHFEAPPDPVPAPS